MIVFYTFSPANTDERATLDELTDNIQGILIGDKGYIGQEYIQAMNRKNIELQTPMRKNMQLKHSQSYHHWLCKQRKTIEVVISQLTERFHIERTETKDIYHFTHRFIRKLLAHTTTVVLCKKLGYSPLQFEKIS